MPLLGEMIRAIRPYTSSQAAEVLFKPVVDEGGGTLDKVRRLLRGGQIQSFVNNVCALVGLVQLLKYAGVT